MSDKLVRVMVYPPLPRVSHNSDKLAATGPAVKEYHISKEAYDAIVRAAQIQAIKDVEVALNRQFCNLPDDLVEYIGFLRHKIERSTS